MESLQASEDSDLETTGVTIRRKESILVNPRGFDLYIKESPRGREVRLEVIEC